VPYKNVTTVCGIQVSLAIGGGCVPGKYSTANTKTAILSSNRLKYAINDSFPLLFEVFKPANSEGRLYYICQEY